MNKTNGDFIKEVSMIKNCSLDYIQYIKNYGNDCAYSDRMIETLLKYADNLKEVYNQRFNEKYDDFEQDPNSKLIRNMTETFKQLNNYAFCDGFFKDNNIYIVNKEEIRKLLNSTNGAKKIMNYFNEIEDNEQLEYLKEIQVINSESIDKIKDEYIPKLNEIINENKNKSKDIER